MIEILQIADSSVGLPTSVTVTLGVLSVAVCVLAVAGMVWFASGERRISSHEYDSPESPRFEKD